MTALIITLVLLLGVYLPILLRELRSDTAKIKCSVTLHYDGSDSFESVFMRFARKLSGMELHIKIIDLVATDESRRWLEHLSEKSDIAFDIITK